MPKTRTKPAPKTLRTWWVVQAISPAGQISPLFCRAEKAEALRAAEGIDERVIQVRERSAAAGDEFPKAWVVEKQREDGTWFTAGIVDALGHAASKATPPVDALGMFLAGGCQKHRFIGVVRA